MRDPVSRVCRLLGWQIFLQLFAIVLLLALAMKAYGQEHHHPPQDAGLHAAYYATWRSGGCCGSGDCYPTKATWKNGGWQAVRREDGKLLSIPTSTIDYGIIPDGRAHLCAPSPENVPMYEKEVFCFQPPEGGT